MRQTSQRAPSSLDRSHHTVTSRIKAGKQRESPTFPTQIPNLDAKETNPKYPMTVFTLFPEFPDEHYAVKRHIDSSRQTNSAVGLNGC